MNFFCGAYVWIVFNKTAEQIAHIGWIMIFYKGFNNYKQKGLAWQNIGSKRI